jgi:predicted DsbA family dithiol-disulfide isomerase
MTIKVAHDFICPWCWIGLHQAKRLKQEFGVSFDWVGYELFPDELPWPEHSATPEVQTNRPKTPTRLDLAYAAEGMEPPTAERPKKMRIHNAMEAVEHAKTEGKDEELVEALYNAYWLEGVEINNPEEIERIATGIVSNIDELRRTISERRFKHNIIGFDNDAYAAGVYNVPTFFIGGERYAEQPYDALRKAMRESLVAR